MKKFEIVLSLFLSSIFVTAAALGPASASPPLEQNVTQKVKLYRKDHEHTILQEFVELLSIPNVASDTANIRKNAEFIVSLLQPRGITTRLLEVQDGPPAVYGELKSNNAVHTLGIYVHYDGQPVDPSQWTGSPWKPVLRNKKLEEGGKEIPWSEKGPLQAEGRIYARSVADDKAPIIGWLAAIDALKAAKIPASVNVKFLFDGEEEAGSAHLPQIIQKHADLVKADAWLFCDGPVHQSGRMQVYFGARGSTDLEITVYGPIRPVHSGHYGNWVPNPVLLLSDLLTSMRDTEGQIRIAHYYDDVRPLSEREKQAVKEIPDVDEELKSTFGLARTEGNGKKLVELILALPAMNLRGIQAGHVGQDATNAIPSEAQASIDLRTVPDQAPDKIIRLVEDHITGQGFFIVHENPNIEIRRKYAKIVKLEWGKGYPASRTSMDLPISQALIKTIENSLGSPIVKMPGLGGTIPMYLFHDVLKTPVIGVPIANYDNNQHAANENLRLQNLWDGIEIYAAILAGLGQHWH